MNLIYKVLGVLYAPKLHVSFYRNDDSKQPLFIFLHGIGNSASSWDAVISYLPKNTPVLVVDLLGFGDSPKPSWATYNASQHTLALERTLRTLHPKNDLILVGHSLGALVSIEYARKHPRKVANMVLCSPPFYQPPRKVKGIWIPKDEAYRKLYRFVRTNSTSLLMVAKLFNNYMSFNKGRSITEDTLPAYVKSLESSIENQRSYQDIQRIRVKTDILYGRFDVLLIKTNLEYIAQKNKAYVTLRSVAAGHEVLALYTQKLVKLLNKKLLTYQVQDRPK